VSGVLASAVSTTIPVISGAGTIPTFPPGSGGTITSGGGSSTTLAPALGLASVLGVFGVVLAVVAMVAVVGVLIIVIVANRADPDPTGRRPQAVYFFAVSFVTILVAVIASTVVVATLTILIGTHPSNIGNVIARIGVLGGLLTLVSVVLLVTHLRRGVVLALADPGVSNPSRRVGQTYVAAVSFLMVLVLLLVSVFAIYLIVALAGPGVFGSFGGRAEALRYLIDALFLGTVAAVILWTHRNLVPPGLRLFGTGVGTDLYAGPPSTSVGPLPPPA
jgi:hypothetical protein